MVAHSTAALGLEHALLLNQADRSVMLATLAHRYTSLRLRHDAKVRRLTSALSRSIEAVATDSGDSPKDATMIDDCDATASAIDATPSSTSVLVTAPVRLPTRTTVV